LWFDTGGYLVRILAGPRIRVDIRRNSQAGPLAGTIAAVTDGQGHSLAFAYRVAAGRAYLSHIDSALGRYQYRHEAAGETAAPGALRLAAMLRPDGMQRRYLYEAGSQAGNAMALTGIEILSADQKHRQRISTWAYDLQGRAVLSIRGGPDSQAGRISLQYVRPPAPRTQGLTIVTDARQRQTRFETARQDGRYVLTRVAGAGCAGCAAPGSQASYDGQGRLREINGARLQRDASGAIRQLEPGAPGWPALVLRYRPDGLRASWSSALTGSERMLYEARSLPAQRVWANGDSAAYQYDAQGRPLRLVEKGAGATQETTLQWRGGLLVRIVHPNETESRQYDRQGKLSRRSVERASSHSHARLRYTESFEYDRHGRMLRHHLPEGGSLSYRWGADHRLAGISWRDAGGQVHSVMDSAPGQAGYCYGNGLCLKTVLGEHGQARQLTLASASGQDEVWSLEQHYDKHGRLQQEHHAVPAAGHEESWSYAYDDQARLIGAQGGPVSAGPDAAPGGAIWYAWTDDGALAAKRENGATFKPSIRRDASGLPLAVGDATLSYGADRRLAAVHRRGGAVANYLHNAYGHRIVRRGEQADTDYFYL
ncbi:MAG: hypothetical protein ACTS5Y_09775, partial [Pollutimonas bauzanensis]